MQVEIKNIINDQVWVNAIDQTMCTCDQGYASGKYTVTSDPMKPGFVIMVFTFPATADVYYIQNTINSFNTLNKAQDPYFVDIEMRVIPQSQVQQPIIPINPQPPQQSTNLQFKNITRNDTVDEIKILKKRYHMTSQSIAFRKRGTVCVNLYFDTVQNATKAKEYLNTNNIFGVNGDYKVNNNKTKDATKKTTVKKDN